MASTENLNSWEIIQQGVRDSERLLSQKQYNLSMVKARQTLEYMVKLLGEKACIVNGDLMDIIDTLYQGQWISKSTHDNYHKIRTIGNKAAHEGNNNAYDANKAYDMLSQEVHTFANEYSGRKRSAARSSSRPAARSSSSSARQTSSSRQTSPRQTSTSRPTSSSRQTSSRSGSVRNTTAATRSRRRPQGQRGFAITPLTLLRGLIPVLIVILLIALIRFFKPANDEKETTTMPPVTTEVPATTAPAETTAPPEETAAPVMYKATTNVRIRKEPNTNADNEPLGQLLGGTTIQFIRVYEENPEWTVVMYEGKEAYIASKYLIPE